MAKIMKALCLGCLLCCAILFAGRVYAFDVTVQYTSDTEVRIRWKKTKKAGKYIVRRKGYKYGKNSGKFKKYKTLSASSDGFTEEHLKAGWVYLYEIEVLNSKGKPFDSAYTDLYTGSAPVSWGEYQTTDSAYSTRKIPLEFTRETGVLPTGYLLYRRDVTAGEKKFTRIASIRGRKAWEYHYTDKKVKAGHKYKYRIRSYVAGNGKKRYGPYSETLVMKAVPKSAALTTTLLTELSDFRNGKIVVSVTSAKDNAPLVFTDSVYELRNFDSWYDEELGGFTEPESEVSLEMVSADGETWQKIGKGCTLKKGETLYLQFLLNEEALPYTDRLPEKPVIESEYGVWYNDLVSSLMLDTGSGMGNTWTNLEFYH